MGVSETVRRALAGRRRPTAPTPDAGGPSDDRTRAYRFNPPPEWPPLPPGFDPEPGWRPDESWPPLPPGWQLWVPAGSARRRALTKRRNLIIVGCALGVLVVGTVMGGMAVSTGNGPAAARTAKPLPSASESRPEDVAAGGRVRTFLPRLRNVSGLAAFTAECRDNWYRPHGSAVDVTVAFRGPGVVAVGVYPTPGDGTDQQTQVHAMGRKESEHTFAFRYVPGKIHHVRVSVTTKTGADQCYARRR